MDIATHAFMGLTLAYPLLQSAPLTAAAFVFGSVLPDLDAFSRLAGKRAFLAWHQTFTHSVPLILLAGAVLWAAVPLPPGEGLAPLAFVAGLLLHVLLDVSNTYGTAVLAPFSRRRICLEWTFFIDAPTLLLTAGTLALHASGFPGATVSMGYVGLLAVHLALRAALRHRAGAIAPKECLSLLPDAFRPWLFHGTARDGTGFRTFRVDVFRARTLDERAAPVPSDAPQSLLASLPEFRAMTGLSPAYTPVFVTPTPEGLLVVCRDLRTPHFGGRFGQLDVLFDSSGRVIRSNFHV